MKQYNSLLLLNSTKPSNDWFCLPYAFLSTTLSKIFNDVLPSTTSLDNKINPAQVPNVGMPSLIIFFIWLNNLFDSCIF